jgi:colicin import membrane protein
MIAARVEDNSLKLIVPSVLLLHGCAIFLLLFISYEHVPLPIPKKLVVSSVKLTPKVTTPPKPIAPIAAPPQAIPQPKPEAPIEAKPKEPAKSPPKESKPVEKAPAKPEKKPVPKKPVTPVKKPAAKPKPVKAVAAKPAEPKPAPPKTPQLEQKQKELLTKAKEKIGKIDTASDKVIATGNLSKALPTALAALSIDNLSVEAAPSMGIEELAYRDELAIRLKLYLKLPEYGEVKLKLKLERSGKVMDVNIVNSSSEKNSAYIRKTLPGLALPPFGNQFKGESSYTFTITLSNE